MVNALKFETSPFVGIKAESIKPREIYIFAFLPRVTP